MRRLIRYVTCACILQYLLIVEPVPSEWGQELAQYVTCQLDDDDELSVRVPAEANGDERRDQLLPYLLEVRSQR